ncbi:MAG: hypothetical protein IJC55_02790 [Clostridia bacterium]|nr:hypothetical protein [Clostridia bacterium]
MGIAIIAVLGVILAFIATILAFVFIIPEKKRARMNKFGKFLHDLLNFKFLIIEKIIQFCYVLATSFTLVGGFLMLFWFEERYSFSYYYTDVRKEWMGYYGLLVMILGPIVVRIVYELVMMAILAVKNIIQINNKIKNQNGDEVKDTFSTDHLKEFAPAAAQPVVAPAPAAPAAPTASFCTKCGVPLGADGVCHNPNCNQ